MEDFTSGKEDRQNLVRVPPGPSLEEEGIKSGGTKKRSYRIRRIADPHIEARKISGRVYYEYRRGTDHPVYLGDADTILAAVMEHKRKQ